MVIARSVIIRPYGNTDRTNLNSDPRLRWCKRNGDRGQGYRRHSGRAQPVKPASVLNVRHGNPPCVAEPICDSLSQRLSELGVPTFRQASFLPIYYALFFSFSAPGSD